MTARGQILVAVDSVGQVRGGPQIADVVAPVGTRVLDALVLAEPYASRLASQCRILMVLTAEITALEVETANRLTDNC
jgi:hypothetical protein